MVKLITVGSLLSLTLFALWLILRSSVPESAPALDSAPSSAPVALAARVVSDTTAATKNADLSFTSAENTMASQLALLARDDISNFRATFSTYVSVEQFALCKKRMANAHLSPDWEMAKHTTENGHRVTKVSIFGKGMTAFREVNGRYLADRVWCVPLW